MTAFRIARNDGRLLELPELLEKISPEDFSQLLAFDRIEPVGVMPLYRLLVFIATSIANQFVEKDPITMNQVAEYAGLMVEGFEESDEVVSGKAFRATAMQTYRRQ